MSPINLKKKDVPNGTKIGRQTVHKLDQNAIRNEEESTKNQIFRNLKIIFKIISKPF